MAGCWRVLDPFYSRPTQYVQDLMAEITATRKIQYSEYERLYEYYALIRGHITEARKANLEETLLTQANIALMEKNGGIARQSMPHVITQRRSWSSFRTERSGP